MTITEKVVCIFLGSGGYVRKNNRCLVGIFTVQLVGTVWAVAFMIANPVRIDAIVVTARESVLGTLEAGTVVLIASITAKKIIVNLNRKKNQIKKKLNRIF